MLHLVLTGKKFCLMEAVLPLKTSLAAANSSHIKNDHKNYNYNNYDLIRAKILIYSIEKFWCGIQPFQIYVICPDADLAQASRALVADTRRVKLHFLPENSVSTELDDYKNISGWYKQQIIKLAAYKFIQSDCYLTLDSDLVACKPFDQTSFFHNQKIINDWELRAVHMSWWETSAKILGESSDIAKYGLKPTPVVISTKICRDLHEFLDSKYNGMSWRRLLENLGWSEFSLYNLFMDATGLGMQYHCTEQEIRKAGLGIRSIHSFSNQQNFAKWRPELAFLPKSQGFFIVCNSVSLVPPDIIWNKLRKFFEDAPEYSYFESHAQKR